MSMLDIGELSESEIHTDCPFCDGEYVVTGGTVCHALPTCKKYEELPPLAFKKAAEEEEKRKFTSKR